MAKSTVVMVRLNPEELRMLDTICKSKDRGDFNRSELLRLLIHREHARRTTGRSKVSDSDVLSDTRVGRPAPKLKRIGDRVELVMPKR